MKDVKYVTTSIDYKEKSMDARYLGRVYVTGADGFIGSHLVERLIELGHEVTALCIYNSNGHTGWLDQLVQKNAPNLRVVLGDVRDPFFIESTTKGHDTVFHLASLIAIPYSYQAPQSYFETNVNGALNIAEACKKNSISRIVHTSTSEVYGTAQTVPITEKHPLQGQSPYSASKIAADVLFESYYRSFGLPVTTLRPFNTYGPRQSLRAVIPTVIAQILNGETRIRLGSLTPTRDFNFVSDTVEAFIALGSADDGVRGQTYNTGTGREISIGALVELIADLIGTHVNVEEDSERVRPRESEVERLLSDASKLSMKTGWKPQVGLEDGLKRVIKWIQDSSLASRSRLYHR